VETIKRQTRAAYGCLVEGQYLWARALPAAYRVYACSVCGTKAPLQLPYAACGAIYVLHAYAYINFISFFENSFPFVLAINSVTTGEEMASSA